MGHFEKKHHLIKKNGLQRKEKKHQVKKKAGHKYNFRVTIWNDRQQGKYERMEVEGQGEE